MKTIESLIKRSQDVRAKALSSFFARFTKWGLTANRLTLLRALAGPIFVWLFAMSKMKSAFFLLFFAAFLDLLDGGLARFQSSANDRGKFWDVLVDHLNYVFPIFALFFLPSVPSVFIGYQLLIVPVLFLLAIIKESEGRKTDWIIHPFYTIVYFKPLALLAFFLFVFLSIDILAQTVLFLDFVMTLWSVAFAIVLARRWSKRKI